jgi:shikimate kinase
MPRVTLVGYRCSGKSAVAAALAEQLACGWVDADDVLERELGMSIADLVQSGGEPVFRDAEAEILATLLSGEPGVVATGGGAVLRESSRQLLKRHGRPVVWLSAPTDVILRRLAADPATPSRRPALGGGDVVDEVADSLAKREPFYREVADGILDTSLDPPWRLAERIVVWLRNPTQGAIP